MTRIALACAVLFVVACSSPSDRDTEEVTVCGQCQAGYYCDTKTERCLRKLDGGTTDAGAEDGGGAACTTNDQCPHGEICNSVTCVPGCTDQHGCGGGLVCCNNTCVDTQSDETYCGGCEVPACTSAQQCVDGQCSGGPSEKVAGLVSLFEAQGKAPSDFGTLDVTLLVPIISFKRGEVAHDFDGRQDGYGCTGDHYDNQSDPAPGDEYAGTITFSGYAGGAFYGGGGSAASTFSCTRGVGVNGTYACTYSNGSTVAAKPFGKETNPLGSGNITFATGGGSGFGAFNLSSKAETPILKVTQDLGAIKYSTTQDTTLNYTCTNCGSSLVSVTIIASQNAPKNQTDPSPTTGLISCLFPASSSLTIPKGAVAAMFANDTALKSVATTVIRINGSFVTGTDDQNQTVVANTGRGVFGIAAK